MIVELLLTILYGALSNTNIRPPIKQFINMPFCLYASSYLHFIEAVRLLRIFTTFQCLSHMRNTYISTSVRNVFAASNKMALKTL